MLFRGKVKLREIFYGEFLMGQIKEVFRVLCLEHESTINMLCFVAPKNVSSDLSTECGCGKFFK